MRDDSSIQFFFLSNQLMLWKTFDPSASLRGRFRPIELV
jgi:hypothetical protein